MSSTRTNESGKFLKRCLTALIVLVLMVAVVLGFAAAKLPSWPLLILVLAWFMAEKGDPSKFVPVAVGGLIGIAVAFVPGVIGVLVPSNAILPVVGLAAAIFIFLFFNVGQNAYFGLSCALFVTLMTSPSFTATSAPTMIVPTIASYAIGFAVLGGAAVLMARGAAKKAAATGAESVS